MMLEEAKHSSKSVLAESPVDEHGLASTNHDASTDIEQPHPRTPAEDVVPDGGYGWVCIACSASINGCTWGINSTYSIFLAYYLSHNYFPDTSALAYAFIGGLSISMAMLIAPLATFVNRMCGTRITLHIGIFFETLSLVGASFARKKYQIILAQGVCFGWGMGFLFIGSVGIPAQWFKKKRSVANAFSAAGSGCGGLIWTLLTQKLIDTLGLPWAFRVLAIISGSINLIASNVIRDRNAAVGSRYKSFDWSLLHRPEFVLVQAWSWFSMIGYVIVLFSLPAYAHAIGLSASQGSVVGAIFNLGQMVGRPFIGLSSDRYGRINLAALYSALCGVFCLIFWIPSEAAPQPMGLLCFFGIVGGGLAGTFWATVAPVLAEVIDLRDLPSGLSWTWLIMVPPVTVAEPIGLELRRTGVSDWIYIYAQVFCGCMYLAAGLCLWVLRGWKIGQIEERAKEAERLKRTEDDAIVLSENEKEITRSGSHCPAPEHIDPYYAAKRAWQTRSLLRRMFVPKIV